MRKRVSYVWPRRVLLYTTIALCAAIALQLNGFALRLSMWAVVVAWLMAVCAIVWNAVVEVNKGVRGE